MVSNSWFTGKQVMKFIDGFGKIGGSFKLEVLMKIFVVGFPISFRRKELLELFEEYGEVESTKVIVDAKTGNSRCFGFVEMPNEDEAKQAIASLNDTLIETRKLAVMKAKTKEELADNQE